MKFVLILGIIGGIVFFVTQKDKSKEDDKDENTEFVESKSSSKSSSSNKSLSGNELIINQSINEAIQVTNHYNQEMKNASNTSAEAQQRKMSAFIKKYTKALGKAYTASTGKDKSVLKYTKTFNTKWCKLNLAYISSLQKNVRLLDFNYRNISKSQTTNAYALYEISKIVQKDSHYVGTAVNGYIKTIKKYKISNPDIKSYVYSLAKDLRNQSTAIKEVNKATKIFIDKTYRVNLWIQDHTKRNQLVVTKQSQIDDLKTMLHESAVAEKEMSRQLDLYNQL